METQVNKQCHIMDGLDRQNVATIQSAVSQVNLFVGIFLQAGEFKRNQEILFVRLTTHEAPAVDLQTHNRPTCNEVGAILLDASMVFERDLLLHLRGGGLQRISDRHPAYDPLNFTLLFPHGEISWN
jgi:hypothetical protein